MGSLSGLDAEFHDFTIRGGVGHQHGLATHGAIFDIRLLGYREVESQTDGFPAVRTGGFLVLKKVHRRFST
jgi:hypothetical protein